MSTYSRPMRWSDWSRLASRYLRDPHSPYGPGHMSYPALVEMISSSRWPAKSAARMRPKLASAPAAGGPFFLGGVVGGWPEGEAPPQDGPLVRQRRLVAEVVPQPEG